MKLIIQCLGQNDSQKRKMRSTILLSFLKKLKLNEEISRILSAPSSRIKIKWLCSMKKPRKKEYNKNHHKENTNLSTLIIILNLNRTMFASIVHLDLLKWGLETKEVT